jgi:hypothetical protein
MSASFFFSLHRELICITNGQYTEGFRLGPELGSTGRLQKSPSFTLLPPVLAVVSPAAELAASFAAAAADTSTSMNASRSSHAAATEASGTLPGDKRKVAVVPTAASEFSLHVAMSDKTFAEEGPSNVEYSLLELPVEVCALAHADSELKKLKALTGS